MQATTDPVAPLSRCLCNPAQPLAVKSNSHILFCIVPPSYISLLFLVCFAAISFLLHWISNSWKCLTLYFTRKKERVALQGQKAAQARRGGNTETRKVHEEIHHWCLGFCAFVRNQWYFVAIIVHNWELPAQQKLMFSIFLVKIFKMPAISWCSQKDSKCREQSREMGKKNKK